MLEEINNKGLGCTVGDVNCGMIGYADDVMLLAPTLESLKTMVQCCERYANNFHIRFNGKKSQLLIFGSHSQNITLYVNNELVNVVNEIKYLGHIISNKKNDPMIKSVKDDFVKKVNTFLGNFSNVSSEVKSSLFRQYCTSFYGSQSCMLYHSSFNELRIAWRKSMRRIWNVPYRTHGALLPVISSQNPCDVSLYKRFMRHYMSGLNHSNTSVRYIFLSSLYNGGRLLKNLRHVTNYCKIKLFDVLKLRTNTVIKMLENVWQDSITEDDIRVACQVKELCQTRDNFEKWCLDTCEINEILYYLCVS